MYVSIVVPCRHEESNVGPLVERLADALRDRRCEILFVDDSDNDATVEAIRDVAERVDHHGLDITVMHRRDRQRWGGLAGAVVDGIRRARSDRVVVMDADLQHPPELVPALLDRLDGAGAGPHSDLVMASRYRPGGSNGGLNGPLRRLVSTGSTLLAKATFPLALRRVTDPMTGYFAVRRSAVDIEALHARGFKILLEILARNPRLRRGEVPLVFSPRHSGASKSDAGQGMRYLAQLPRLRLATAFGGPVGRYLAGRRTRSSPRAGGAAPQARLPVWAKLALVVFGVAAAYAVFTPGPSTVLIGALLAIALFNTAVSGLDARWRLYGWRTPEAIEEMRWPPPSSAAGATERFSIIVPALHEAAVIGGTLRRLVEQDYPHVEILVSLCAGDNDTIAEVERVMRDADPLGRIRTVVRHYPKSNKPRQLNAALAECRGTIAGVVDAEDDVAPGLLARVDALFRRTGADVVQGGVQLMTLGSRPSDWFKVHNVMEYFFWFTSRMFYQVRHGFVPLGGNTVFVRRELMVRVGGWPDNLTEDCALGVLLCTRYGAKVVAAHEPELATREEVPNTIWNRREGSLFWQRVRWNQGFLSILLQGDWLALPTLRQRVLAGYILATPFLQAASALLVPVALATVFWLKVPVAIAMLMYVPFLPIIISLTAQLIGLHEFGRAYGQRTRPRHYAYLTIGAPLYQSVLMAAAGYAALRHVRGNTTWHKTVHAGHHRPAVATPLAVPVPAMETV